MFRTQGSHAGEQHDGRRCDTQQQLDGPAGQLVARGKLHVPRLEQPGPQPVADTVHRRQTYASVSFSLS